VLSLAAPAAAREAHTVALGAADLPSVRAAIEAQGGRVTHILPDGRLVVVTDGRAPSGFPAGTAVRPFTDALETGVAGLTLVASDVEGVPDALATTGTTASPVMAGDIVLGLVLPESTGAAEPSEVDWTPADIARVIDNAVAGTMRFALAPGAPRLTFRLHLFSAPPPAGAAGTVACAYEAARHANFDLAVDGSWLGALGYADALSSARLALALDLKERYGADGAFVAKVINDRGLTPGRASALLNGPQVTWFRSSPPFVTGHESGHAFGALDEYCPDACRSPTLMSGVELGANANSTGNDGTGYRAGAGEGLPCLMMLDTPRICPHTRAQIGWQDSDHDGLADPEDLVARSAIAAAAITARGLEVSGTAVMQPFLGTAPVVLGRLAGVDVRLGTGAWVAAAAVDGTFDTASEEYSVSVPAPPDGDFTVEARARTTAGNVESVPARTTLHATTGITDAAPVAALAAHPLRARAGSRFRLDATASSDLEGEPLRARFDFDGDGSFDTDFGPLAADHVFATPGTYRTRVEVADLGGSTAAAEVAIEATAADLPPVARLALVAEGGYGDGEPRIHADASPSFDPEGGALSFRFEIEPGGESRDDAVPVMTTTVAVELSETIAVTVRVRDQASQETAITRTIVAVAYDHPPLARLATRAGETPDEVVLDSSASDDPDLALPWDGWLAARFDLDGDGGFETAFAPGQTVATMTIAAEQVFAPVVEVRDRLFATARAAVVIDRRTKPAFAHGVALVAVPAACGIALTWSPATAPSGPVTYSVYRADRDDRGKREAKIAEVVFPGFIDRGALPGRHYSYRVRARAAGLPPLEDGNTVAVAVTAMASDRVVRLSKRGDRVQVDAPSDGGAELVFISPAPGAHEELAAAGVGPLEVDGYAAGLTLVRLAPAECGLNP
jgi:hypothetical protein